MGGFLNFGNGLKWFDSTTETNINHKFFIMANYRIAVIAHLLKSNEVAEFGDVVEESKLIGNPNDLVKKGFIELVDDSKTDSKTDSKKEVKLERLNKDNLVAYALENFGLELKKEDYDKKGLIAKIEEAEEAKKAEEAKETEETEETEEKKE